MIFTNFSVDENNFFIGLWPTWVCTGRGNSYTLHAFIWSCDDTTPHWSVVMWAVKNTHRGRYRVKLIRDILRENAVAPTITRSRDSDVNIVFWTFASVVWGPLYILEKSYMNGENFHRPFPPHSTFFFFLFASNSITKQLFFYLLKKKLPLVFAFQPIV